MGAAAHRATQSARPAEVERRWFVVDATDAVLGRLATRVATILRGKHKAIFTPHVDTGDHVIIVNASKVVLSSGKDAKKMVHSHSGYPGGIKSVTYADSMARKPADTVRKSITGMLPKNRLGRQMATKLKIYAGPEHPHAPQAPKVLEIAGAKREVTKR